MPARILIIEDEEDILLTLKDILEMEGHTVFTASNGREGLDCLDKIPTPDLILLDLLMPVMNGVEFRAAQLKIPRLAQIPILVMSADNSPAARFHEPKLPFLKKPLDLDDLMKVIDTNARPTG